jgi:hypothetical protein
VSMRLVRIRPGGSSVRNTSEYTKRRHEAEPSGSDTEGGSREVRLDQITYMRVFSVIIASETSSSISSGSSGESVFTTMISAMYSTDSSSSSSSSSSSGRAGGAEGRGGFRDARELVLLRRDDEPEVRFFRLGAEAARGEEVEAGVSDVFDECGTWGSEPILLLLFRAGLFPVPLFCPDRALREFVPIMSSVLDLGSSGDIDGFA